MAGSFAGRISNAALNTLVFPGLDVMAEELIERRPVLEHTAWRIRRTRPFAPGWLRRP